MTVAVPGLVDASATAKDPSSSSTRTRTLIAAHKRDFIAGSLLLVVSTAASAATPQFVRNASNAIVAGASQSRVGMTYALLIVVAAVTGALARIGSRIRLFNAGRDIEYDLRAQLLARLHTLGPSFFRRMSAGEIMSRATNDLAQVRLMVGFAALSIVSAIISYAINIPLMLYRNPVLTLAALTPYPLLILVTRGFSGSMFRRSRATQDAIGSMSERAQQSLAGIRVVRAYGLEQAEADAFEKLSDVALEANLSLARLRGALMPIIGTAAGTGMLVVLWLGGRMVMRGTLTVGDILAFQGHLALVAWPTVALGYVFAIAQRGRASLARLNQVLDALPDMDESHATPATDLKGALRVHHLSYRFGEREVLNDVSFELEAGEKLAIVGRTGCGKSTLAGLITRMLPTPQGTVFLDGHDITDLPLRQLRTAVCLAQQEPFLFSTTIAKNIAFADPDPDSDATYARAREAAREAQILEESEAMPQGFDTIVGERGVQLSGGQRQRVALARALLSSPKVLVLDDPMSAVDARTEVAILDAIDRASQGRTVILVTHRIAAASRCQRIVVLEDGAVVEAGTHAELMERGGLYARLAERQALEAELESL